MTNNEVAGTNESWQNLVKDRRAFLAHGTLYDAVRCRFDDDSCECREHWKHWLRLLTVEVIVGPVATFIIWRAAEQHGQNVFGFLIDRVGYYFGITGSLLIGFVWIALFYQLISRRKVTFDFLRREIRFRRWIVGFPIALPLHHVVSVDVDVFERKKSHGLDIPANLMTISALDLSMRGGGTIRVFETANESVARETADKLRMRLDSRS